MFSWCRWPTIPLWWLREDIQKNHRAASSQTDSQRTATISLQFVREAVPHCAPAARSPAHAFWRTTLPVSDMRQDVPTTRAHDWACPNPYRSEVTRLWNVREKFHPAFASHRARTDTYRRKAFPVWSLCGTVSSDGAASCSRAGPFRCQTLHVLQLWPAICSSLRPFVSPDQAPCPGGPADLHLSVLRQPIHATSVISSSYEDSPWRPRALDVHHWFWSKRITAPACVRNITLWSHVLRLISVNNLVLAYPVRAVNM